MNKIETSVDKNKEQQNHSIHQGKDSDDEDSDKEKDNENKSKENVAKEKINKEKEVVSKENNIKERKEEGDDEDDENEENDDIIELMSRKMSNDESDYSVGNFLFVVIATDGLQTATIPFDPASQTPQEFIDFAFRYKHWNNASGECGVDKHFAKYFGLFSRSADGSKTRLKDDESFAQQNILSMTIATIERTDVFKLEIVSVKGPFEKTLAYFREHCLDGDAAFGIEQGKVVLVTERDKLKHHLGGIIASANARGENGFPGIRKHITVAYDGKQSKWLPNELKGGEEVEASFCDDEEEENRIVFRVVVSPQTLLGDDLLTASVECEIEFPEEVVVCGPVKGVSWVYTEFQPAENLTATAALRGALFLTNYKLFFRSYDPEDACKISIPHGCVDKLEKFGHKTGGGANYCVEVTTKQGGVFRLLFRKDSAASRKKFFLLAKEYCFCQNDLPRYLFCYVHKYPSTHDGWNIYSPVREYERMGVLAEGSGWRGTAVNKEYALCSTYPSWLVVPQRCTDDLVAEVARYRSRGRVPILAWRDRETNACIVRSSQPCTGITNGYSGADAAYLLHVLDTNKRCKTLYVMDSRPKSAAVANRAIGGGYEDTRNYKHTVLQFENIPNIHAVREALAGVRAACSPAVPEEQFLAKVSESGWLCLTKAILASVAKSVALVDQRQSTILIHCSDGWDRTSQCSSLAQLCLDPFYRTLRGFIVLVEKEWLSMGHRFGTRNGMGEEKISTQRAPIFYQFVDCVFQILTQFPAEFEFNENFLLQLLTAAYDRRFGTFLCDSERERRQAQLATMTPSLWDYVLDNRELFVSTAYRPLMKVIYPSSSMRELVVWQHALLGNIHRVESRSPVKASRALYQRLHHLPQDI